MVANTIKFLALVAISFSVFIGCVLDKNEPLTGANIQEGDMLPEFSIVMNDGATLTTSSLQNRISVIVLMTTTCGDCQAQMPEIERLHKEYKEMNDVTIFCIGREQKASVMDRYWLEQGFTTPYSAQETRYIYNLFAQVNVPRIYISDKDRVVNRAYDLPNIISFETLKSDIERLKK